MMQDWVLELYFTAKIISLHDDTLENRSRDYPMQFRLCLNYSYYTCLRVGEVIPLVSEV